MRRTMAQQHSWLVEQGANRFAETYLYLAAVLMEGGRLPGIELPSKQDILEFYRSTDEQYWQNIGQSDPSEGKSQLQQWQQAEGSQ